MAVPSADMCTGPWQWAGGLSDGPMLTFRLTVAEYPSQSTIPTVENHRVSGSFNTFTVELCGLFQHYPLYTNLTFAYKTET